MPYPTSVILSEGSKVLTEAHLVDSFLDGVAVCLDMGQVNIIVSVVRFLIVSAFILQRKMRPKNEKNEGRETTEAGEDSPRNAIAIPDHELTVLMTQKVIGPHRGWNIDFHMKGPAVFPIP